jgi:very-short-patch-repair endonuclease
VPIGNFIADFVAPSVQLVVEVDGTCHITRAAADARKDRFLRRAGYRVLRISAEVVMRNLDEAVERVKAALGAGLEEKTTASGALRRTVRLEHSDLAGIRPTTVAPNTVE